MRFFSFIPFFRARRAKTIKIRRVLPTKPALAITFHVATVLALSGLLTGIFVLFSVAGRAAILEQSRMFADPSLLAVLLSANTCAFMFSLNRNAH